MTVTGHPPYRPVLAALPHTVLTSDVLPYGGWRGIARLDSHERRFIPTIALPCGRGSVSSYKHRHTFLSRARQQAVACLFQQAPSGCALGSSASYRRKMTRHHGRRLVKSL